MTKLSEMKCEVCGQGPASGTSLYRTGPKGSALHWRCEFHTGAEHKPSHEVAVLIGIIEADGKSPA